MPRDPEAFAEMVILTVKAALAPIMERLAVAEQRNAELQMRVQDFAGLRDRLVTVETKASDLRHPEPVAVDLAPVLERVAVAEAILARCVKAEEALTDLRDRVVSVETKAAAPVVSEPVIPPPIDLSPVLIRVSAVETTLATFGELRDRLVTVETKVAMPLSVESPLGLSPAEQELELRNRLEPLMKELTALRERLLVLEVRAPIPGPPGQHGKDGENGHHGIDGLGFDDLDVQFDGDRTLSLTFTKGTATKTWPIVLPYQRYQGVYQEGKSYAEGDVATWAGSTWHCKSATTTKPGEGSAAWVLIVKRGRDGRDGHDAPVIPVVSIARTGAVK